MTHQCFKLKFLNILTQTDRFLAKVSTGDLPSGHIGSTRVQRDNAWLPTTYQTSPRTRDQLYTYTVNKQTVPANVSLDQGARTLEEKRSQYVQNKFWRVLSQ